MSAKVWLAVLVMLLGVFATFNGRAPDSDEGLHAAASLMLADGMKAVSGGADIRSWAMNYNAQFKSFGGWVYQEPVPYVVRSLFFIFFRKMENHTTLFLPNILATAAIVFVIYDFGRNIYGEKAGIFSAFIFAMYPITISFSKSVFPGVMAALFLLLSAKYLWIFGNNGEGKSAFLAGLFFALAVFSKYPIVLLGPVLGYLVYKKDKKHVLAAAGPTLVIGALWFGVLFSVIDNPLDAFNRAKDANTIFYFPRLIGYLPYFFLLLSTPFAILLFCGTVDRFRTRKLDIPLFYLAYFLAPTFVFWPAFESPLSELPGSMRFLLPCIPFFALICGDTLSKLPKKAGTIIITFMFLTFVPFTRELESFRGNREYEDVLEYLSTLEGANIVSEDFQLMRAFYLAKTPEGKLVWWWQTKDGHLEELLTPGSYENYGEHCKIDYYLGVGELPETLSGAYVGEEIFESFVLYELDPEKTCLNRP